MNSTLLCSLMELFPLGREPGPSSQPPDDNRLTESPDCELPPVELQYVHIAEVPSLLVYFIEPHHYRHSTRCVRFYHVHIPATIRERSVVVFRCKREPSPL